MTEQDITDTATGKSRLLAEQCATCIFRPGNPMHLQPERLAQLVTDALARGSYIICHDTLTYGPHPTYRPAICRGFHDAYRHHSLALRLMYALNNITEVPPPPADHVGAERADGGTGPMLKWPREVPSVIRVRAVPITPY